MSDRILGFSSRPAARRLARSVGVSLPPQLDRTRQPWSERPLEGETVAVLLSTGAELTDVLAGCLAKMGAEVALAEPLPAFSAGGEAWARPPRGLEGLKGEKAVVLDATGVRDVAGLRELYTRLQPRLKGLARCGRVALLARPPSEMDDVTAAAAQRGVEGFVRSLGREVGRTGATANLLIVPRDADDRVPGVLHFLLSARSAYISGQPLRLSAGVAAEFRATRPLDGRVALVTGAARGIGAATAHTLSREGAHVIVHDHPASEKLARDIAEEVGGEAFTSDLSTTGGVNALINFIENGLGRVDVLVQNAGVTRDRTLRKMSDDEWDLTLAVNLQAVLSLNAVLDPMVSDDARIICLSSIAGIAGNVGQTNYATTKAGVIGLVEALAPTLAPRGIAISAVAPGFIETRLTAAIPFATREVARRLCNLSQGGIPQDIAEAITFLASPAGGALSGSVLRVCGGNLVGA